MCLFKAIRQIQIADKDIECYKVLKSNLQSMYYQFQYELNKKYSKNWDEEFIEYATNKTDLGGNMFHVSTDKELCIHFYGERILARDEDGFPMEVVLSDSQVLIKCIIPKGTRYYQGSYSEIGTETLIIKEICV